MKYNNKRDPTTEELIQAASSYNMQIGNRMKDIASANLGANKEKCVDKICCSTHASSLQLLQEDPKNICRDVNKLIANCFFKEFGMTAGDSKMDPFMAINEENKNKLNAIMPILNSVHLWGRYKQKHQ